MMDPDRIHRLTRTLYDASHDDALWPVVAREISDLFDGATIALDDNASMGDPFGLAASARFDTTLQPVHFEEYHTPQSNPGLAALMRAEVGRAFALHTFLTPEQFERDPSCRDILRPQGIDKGLIVTFQRSGGSLGFMNVLRRVSEAELDIQEAAAVDLLAAHLARACDLRRRLVGRRVRGAAHQLALGDSRTTEGMLVVTTGGMILDADAAAELLLANASAIAQRSARPVSTSKLAGQDSEALARFIAQPPPSLRPFVVREADGTVTLLDSLPISDIAVFDGRQASRILVVRQMAPRRFPSVARFSAAYDLSRAEARVVDALTRAPSATAAATQLGISRETMKTHLGRLYAKTGTQSLPQLMLLVGRFS